MAEEEIIEQEEVKGAVQPTEEKGITLSKKEYGELLDRIARAEAKMEYMPQREEKEEEEVPEEPVDPGQFAKMTPDQFFKKILDEVDKKVTNPVMLAVATLQTRMEIDKAARDHDDFWDYEKDIKRVASANPTMSIEDAYLLVKSKKGPSLKDKEPKTEEKKEPPKPPFGEKPQLNKEALKQQPKTTREAAKMALEVLNLETKEEGK